jgi:hypothetical protein
MASIGHILSGNHKVIHTNGSMPINGFYPLQADHMGILDLAMEACLERHLHH